MNRKLVVAALACGLLVLSGPALADVKDPNQIGRRNGPPSFSPLQGPFCNTPFEPIPDADSGQVVDTQSVSADLIIDDLNVGVQITHSWIGDLRGSLEGPGCSVQLWLRIGVDGDVCCGCSGDDMDVTLDDQAGDSIENSCGSGPNGGAAGPWQPGDPVDFPEDTLAACNGTNIQGDWTLTVSDGAAGDTGTLNEWCLFVEGTPPGGDGGGVPATSTWGVVLLIALFLGVSLFYLRRRSPAGA